jgi:hypothetical protein
MRKEITWISPLRLGLIQAAIVAVIWIVFGILGLIFHGMGPGPGMATMGGGVGAVLGGIVMGAIAGFIGGAIAALVYNVAAGIVGGVVIELKDG